MKTRPVVLGALAVLFGLVSPYAGAGDRALVGVPAPQLRQISDFRDVTDLRLTDQVIREMVYLSPFGMDKAIEWLRLIKESERS